jgi:hemolysin activation/secretion protein
LLCLLIWIGPLLSEEIKTGIQGIFITSKQDHVLFEGRPNVRGIEFDEVTVPGGEEKLRGVLKSYLGRRITKSNAIEIKQKIIAYYVSQNNQITGVEFPEQKTTGGVLQIWIIQKKFDKAIYKGETWYSNEQLNKYLAIQPGYNISEDALQNNLSWLNRNPFQNTSMKYAPGSTSDTYDIEFISKKRRALRFYTRADDTGSPYTGYGRFAGGFNWGNAFGIGDLLSFEYCTSNEFKRYQSFTANYTSFLPWQHMLLVLGTCAFLEPDVQNANVNAKIAEAQVRYVIPFKPLYTPFTQSVSLGFDYKYTNSNFLALTPAGVEIAITGPPVVIQQNISQLYGSYTFSYIPDQHNFAGSFEVYFSPGDILAHQSNSTFNAANPHSKNAYAYLNTTLGEVYTHRYFSLTLLLRGQAASGTLPPTELFCLGGYNTVRGYHEVELATDNGLIANIELRSPPIQLWKKAHDALTFLAFLDYGLGNNWFQLKDTPFGTPPHTQYLLGTGPGLRYTINPYVQARIDYGFKLHELYAVGHTLQELRLGFGQFHLGLLMSY